VSDPAEWELIQPRPLNTCPPPRHEPATPFRKCEGGRLGEGRRHDRNSCPRKLPSRFPTLYSGGAAESEVLRFVVSNDDSGVCPRPKSRMKRYRSAPASHIRASHGGNFLEPMLVSSQAQLFLLLLRPACRRDDSHSFAPPSTLFSLPPAERGLAVLWVCDVALFRNI